MGDTRGPFPWVLVGIFTGAAVAGAGIGFGIVWVCVRVYEMFTGT